MGEFIKKGNKYFRNNSDGTLTEVTPTKDGYFTWTLPDGKKVRSQRKYKITTLEASSSQEEPSFWDKVKKGFVNATIGASVAEAPAIQTANGWYMDDNGDWKQDPGRPGAKLLRSALAAIGAAGAMGYGGAAALSYTPSIVPEITIGLLPWWQTAIGNMAGSMATGMTADMVSKATTAKTVGGNIGEAFRTLTDIPYGENNGPLSAILKQYPNAYNFVWDMTNPFYLTSPSTKFNVFSNIAKYRRLQSAFNGRLPGHTTRDVWTATDPYVSRGYGGEVRLILWDPNDLNIFEAPKTEIPVSWSDLPWIYKNRKFYLSLDFSPTSMNVLNKNGTISSSSVYSRQGMEEVIDPIKYLDELGIKRLTTDDIVNISKNEGHNATKIYNIYDGPATDGNSFWSSPIDETILHEGTPYYTLPMNSSKWKVLPQMNWSFKPFSWNFKYYPTSTIIGSEINSDT